MTYPDGSEININKGFVKTWRLQNNGSCTWTSGYKLIFSNGDRMGAPDEVVLTGGTVAPGQTVDVSVNLTAPDTAGTYKGYFKLKSSDGEVFGIGAGGTTSFYVEIKAVIGILLLPPLLITPLVIVTPQATVTYTEQLNCNGKYYLKFRVQNTGTIEHSNPIPSQQKTFPVIRPQTTAPMVLAAPVAVYLSSRIPLRLAK